MTGMRGRDAAGRAAHRRAAAESAEGARRGVCLGQSRAVCAERGLVGDSNTVSRTRRRAALRSPFRVCCPRPEDQRVKQGVAGKRCLR